MRSAIVAIVKARFMSRGSLLFSLPSKKRLLNEFPEAYKTTARGPHQKKDSLSTNKDPECVGDKKKRCIRIIIRSIRSSVRELQIWTMSIKECVGPCHIKKCIGTKAKIYCLKETISRNSIPNKE